MVSLVYRGTWETVLQIARDWHPLLPIPSFVPSAYFPCFATELPAFWGPCTSRRGLRIIHHCRVRGCRDIQTFVLEALSVGFAHISGTGALIGIVPFFLCSSSFPLPPPLVTCRLDQSSMFGDPFSPPASSPYDAIRHIVAVSPLRLLLFGVLILLSKSFRSVYVRLRLAQRF
ncbi:hypothetical protein EDC04DRAFT_378571 [Pisolithus marmoratus]|nr:hypothetical protein EDC04DRAFT_378571 [Pisolithus marmoratus]